VLPHRGFAAPFTLPSLVCGLLLRVRLALRRHQFRFRHLAFTARFAPAICSPTCTRRLMTVSVTAL
jgi:hypothetical protein